MQNICQFKIFLLQTPMAQNYKKIYLLIGLSGFAIFIWTAIFNFNSQKTLAVDFLNVGQGDAILIRAPENKEILIDAGPNSSLLNQISKKLPFYNKTIEGIIITHPDNDHIAGFTPLLERYKVLFIIYTGLEHNLSAYNRILEIAKEKHIPLYLAKAGSQIKISDELTLDIIAPFENFSGKTAKKNNNTSIVSRLVYGKTSYLFTGDAEAEEENKLLESKQNINSDVLKVGHHGSKSSSSEDFLKMVSPKISIISAGKYNRYGHPHKETLERLKTTGTQIFRTDENGNIEIQSDGENLTLENF